MTDIVERLRNMSGMLTMCEKIPFGSDATLMAEAANEITSLRSSLAERTEQCAKVADGFAVIPRFAPRVSSEIPLMAPEVEAALKMARGIAAAIRSLPPHQTEDSK